MRVFAVCSKIAILSLCCVLVYINQCCYDNPDENCNYAPADCDHTKPADGSVQLQLNIGKSTMPVIVEVYKGTVENGELIKSFTASNDAPVISVPNGQIAARATYKTIIDGTDATVQVVDGGKLDAKSKDYCDNVTCYDEGLLDLDLRLKIP